MQSLLDDNRLYFCPVNDSRHKKFLVNLTYHTLRKAMSVNTFQVVYEDKFVSVENLDFLHEAFHHCNKNNILPIKNNFGVSATINEGKNYGQILSHRINARLAFQIRMQKDGAINFVFIDRKLMMDNHEQFAHFCKLRKTVREDFDNMELIFIAPFDK